MTASTTKKRSTRTRKATPKSVTTESYPVVITKEDKPLSLFELSVLPFLYLEYFTKLLWKTSTKSMSLL